MCPPPAVGKERKFGAEPEATGRTNVLATPLKPMYLLLFSNPEQLQINNF